MAVRGKDLPGFEADLDKFARTIGISVALARKRVAFSVFGSLIKRTPVDTGRARASWAMADRTPSGHVAPEGRRTPGAAAQEARGAVTAQFVDPWEVTWITNRLPYIQSLEDGHSKQAPHGFVRIALAETEAEILAELS